MTQKHFIKVSSGEKIAAIHHEADSDKWIFFCHGFGSDKEGSYIPRCEKAVEEGYNAVRFDFRGNGESNGEFIEQNLSTKIEDLKAVIDHFQPEKYVLFGSSFGGKVVLHASTNLEPEALVLKAPVTYNEIMDKFRAVVENKGEFEHHPGVVVNEKFFEDFDRYSFDNVVESLEIPVLIFHGSKDSTVHIEHSFKALDELDTDVTLQKLKDEKHSFTDNAEKQMQETMFNWLKTDF